MMPNITHILDEDEVFIEFFVNGTFITKLDCDGDPEESLDEFNKIYMAGFDRGRNYEKSNPRT